MHVVRLKQVCEALRTLQSWQLTTGSRAEDIMQLRCFGITERKRAHLHVQASEIGALLSTSPPIVPQLGLYRSIHAAVTPRT